MTFLSITLLFLSFLLGQKILKVDFFEKNLCLFLHTLRLNLDTHALMKSQ